MVHVQVIQHNFEDLSPGNTQGYFIKNYVMTMLTRSSVQRRQEIIDLVNGGRRINSSGKGNALLHGLHPAGSNSAVLFLELSHLTSTCPHSPHCVWIWWFIILISMLKLQDFWRQWTRVFLSFKVENSDWLTAEISCFLFRIEFLVFSTLFSNIVHAILVCRLQNSKFAK